MKCEKCGKEITQREYDNPGIDIVNGECVASDKKGLCYQCSVKKAKTVLTQEKAKLHDT